jgi:hypothetical protein
MAVLTRNADTNEEIIKIDDVFDTFFTQTEVTTKLTNYYTKSETYTKSEVNAAILNPDWKQTDTTKKDFIKNKPTIPTVKSLRDLLLEIMNLKVVLQYNGNSYDAVALPVGDFDCINSAAYSNGGSEGYDAVVASSSILLYPSLTIVGTGGVVGLVPPNWGTLAINYIRLT